METKRKFEPIVNQGKVQCPPPPPPCPHPLPPPGPCPHPHGQIFQGCIAYINSYIDVRMRQLYIKLKDLIHKIAGKYHGPWDYILLRDTDHPDDIYKVYITEGNLRSNIFNQSREIKETFKVTFNANGGEFMDTLDNLRTVDYQKDSQLGDFPTDIEFSYDEIGEFADYAELEGWYTQPIGGEQVFPDTVVEGDVTYYAHWNRYLYFDKVGQFVTIDENNVASGFSKTSYLRVSKELDYQKYPFELVMNATSGDYETLQEREQEIVGNDILGLNIEIGTKEGMFHWELGRNPFVSGQTPVQENTEYYTKLVKDKTNQVSCYVKRADEEDWTLEYTTKSNYRFVPVQLLFGNDMDALTQYWGGSIDFNKSYLILNGNKYFFRLRDTN